MKSIFFFLILSCCSLSAQNHASIPNMLQNLVSGKAGVSDSQPSKQPMCTHMVDAEGCKDENASAVGNPILKHVGYISNVLQNLVSGKAGVSDSQPPKQPMVDAEGCKDENASAVGNPILKYVGNNYVKDAENENPEQTPLEVIYSSTRVDILSELDRLLTLLFASKGTTFTLFTPPKTTIYEPNLPQLHDISKNYGFYSSHPIVATTTSNNSDMKIGCGAMKDLYNNGSKELIQIASAELLTKIMAYRNLEKGQILSIPTIEGGKVTALRYRIDKTFDLWLGMPAYGLTPLRKNTPAILLFRGTNFNITSVAGVASIISDFDINGPGKTIYDNNRKQIQNWLTEMKNQGSAARVLGYSLGGALAIYTYLDNYPLLANEGSIAFNPPGISKETLAEWQPLTPAQKKGLTVYVTDGDSISKTGYLVGKVYSFSTNQPLSPLEAHTLFISGMKKFTQSAVDVDKENATRE